MTTKRPSASDSLEETMLLINAIQGEQSARAKKAYDGTLTYSEILSFQSWSVRAKAELKRLKEKRKKLLEYLDSRKI